MTFGSELFGLFADDSISQLSALPDRLVCLCSGSRVGISMAGDRHCADAGRRPSVAGERSEASSSVDVSRDRTGTDRGFGTALVGSLQLSARTDCELAASSQHADSVAAVRYHFSLLPALAERPVSALCILRTRRCTVGVPRGGELGRDRVLATKNMASRGVGCALVFERSAVGLHGRRSGRSRRERARISLARSGKEAVLNCLRGGLLQEFDSGIESPRSQHRSRQRAGSQSQERIQCCVLRVVGFVHDRQSIADLITLAGGTTPEGEHHLGSVIRFELNHGMVVGPLHAISAESHSDVNIDDFPRCSPTGDDQIQVLYESPHRKQRDDGTNDEEVVTHEMNPFLC